MTKDRFLNKLSQALEPLDHKQRRDVLRDYEEHFEVGLEEGRTEEEIAASLGDPESIAREIRAEVQISRAKEDTTAGNVARAAFATLSLSLVNLIFVLPVFAAVVAVLFSFFAVAVTLVASPVLVVIQYGWGAGAMDRLRLLFLTMALGGFGVLWGVGTIYLTRGTYRLALRYLEFNLDIIRGKQ